MKRGAIENMYFNTFCMFNSIIIIYRYYKYNNYGNK
jgi:hypothetical protein